MLLRRLPVLTIARAAFAALAITCGAAGAVFASTNFAITTWIGTIAAAVDLSF